MPTLLNMMSSRPNRSTAAAIIATHVGLLGDVALLGHGGAARRLDRRDGLLAGSASMSAHTTRAPSSANRSAEARPTPDPAPVTIADLPSSSTLCSRSF